MGHGSQQGDVGDLPLRPRVGCVRCAGFDGPPAALAGEIVPSEETLAGTWAWVKVRDHERLYRTLVEEGFIHHSPVSRFHRRDAEDAEFLTVFAESNHFSAAHIEPPRSLRLCGEQLQRPLGK